MKSSAVYYMGRYAYSMQRMWGLQADGKEEVMDLKAIRERAEAATDRPMSHAWMGAYHVIGFQDKGGSWNNDLLCSDNAANDAELFCHAREDILALLELVGALERTCNRLCGGDRGLE